jgi:hypothetical protein
MSEDLSTSTPEVVAKSLSDRLVVRRTAGEATPEQIQKAKDVVDRVKVLIDSNNQQHPNRQPVTELETRGVWTYDKPTGHQDEQKNSRGFKIDAESTVKIEITDRGVALTETTRERTHLKRRSGPSVVTTSTPSHRLTVRERILYIDNDGLTVFGEFVQLPKHQEGSVHDDGELVESVLRESPEGERVPFIQSEQEFAEKVLTYFDPQQVVAA